MLCKRHCYQIYFCSANDLQSNKLLLSQYGYQQDGYHLSNCEISNEMLHKHQFSVFLFLAFPVITLKEKKQFYRENHVSDCSEFKSLLNHYR